MMNGLLYQKPAAGVQERVEITGTLELLTPTGLGNGDQEALTDVVLRRDEISQEPVLPGSSLAGALRTSLLRQLDSSADNRRLVNRLFGTVTRTESRQSWLFVDDSLGDEAGIEIRDGVAIDPATRTAEHGKKFDLELLAAGTTFPLRLEFWKPADPKLEPEKMLEGLCLALLALEAGDIHLGVRKRRGFGECRVSGWRVIRYPMDQIDGLLDWLERRPRLNPAGEKAGLAEQLGLASMSLKRSQQDARLSMELAWTDSLLIRSAPLNSDLPDQIHLRNNANQPVLPGTSLAGALRARASRILHCRLPEEVAKKFLEDLFGPRMGSGEDDGMEERPRGSRLWVKERVITGGLNNQVQHRVKIDRFTSGSFPGALFEQQPHLLGSVIVELSIQEAKEADIGLLLLLVKDLWTEFLPLGGEASVGRGRTKGKWAELAWQSHTWRIETDGEDKLLITRDGIADSRTQLEKWVESIADAQAELEVE